MTDAQDDDVAMLATLPSPRELDVLKALWALGSGSVREVHDRMCPNGELAYNTVQTLLRIMDDKGLVSHRAEGRTFIYYPRYDRQQHARRFLDRVFDGALDQVVLSLIEAKDASPEELRELERLVARARRDRQFRDEPPASSRASSKPKGGR
jgi:predicted transcriptional regulator